MGAYYWYVKIPQRGYMERGLKDIPSYVKKHIAPPEACYNFPLDRDKPLVASAFVKLVRWNLSVTTASKITFVTCDLFNNVF